LIKCPEKKNVGINPPTGRRPIPWVDQTDATDPLCSTEHEPLKLSFYGRSQRAGAGVDGERCGSASAKANIRKAEFFDQEYVSDSKLKLGAIHHLSMPNVMHYRRLAREYDLKAQRATDPLYAEGYRRLADGYECLAEGFSVLVNAHRSANDRLSDVPPSVSEVDQPDHR
jgi:hypothetical protein